VSDSAFFLNPASLAARVQAATYERGLGVYRSQLVLDYSLTAVNSQEWSLAGSVQGSGREIYDVSVTVEASPQGEVTYFNGDCSCPVGHDCKHSVALAIKAAYKSGGFRAFMAQTMQTAQTSPPEATNDQRLSPQELEALKEAQKKLQIEARMLREAQQAEGKVSQWLDLFGPEVAATGPAYAAEDAHHDEHLVYTLSTGLVGAQKVLKLGSGFTRQLLNGNWAKLKLQRYFNPADLTPQDTEIFRLIDSLTPRSYSYATANNQAVLAGSSGMLALKLAAETGRLYASVNDRLQGKPLQIGPSQALRFGWREIKTTDDSAKAELLGDPLWVLTPELENPEGDLEWFANTPPLYLHLSAGLCGSVELPGVSSEHLSLLIKAPPIPQSAFAKHETTLLRRLAGLPLPPMIKPPTVLQGITPVAHLRISRVADGEVNLLGLLRATLRFGYADLMFYGAHNQNPVLLERPESAAGEPAARALLHRDLHGEQAAHNTLRGLGLAGDTKGQFYLPFRSAAQQQLWLQWADEGFAALQQAGLVVEVMPDLHDWISRADTLDVRMTARGESDHAADHDGDPSTESQSPWFDLSLGMAIDGRRQNILPLLPQLLAQVAAHAHADAAGASGDAVTLQLPDYVYLKQEAGDYLRLPTEPLRPWLQALLELVGDKTDSKGQLKGDTLRLSRLEALRLGASLGAGARWQGADSLREMVNQLAGRSSLPAVAAPEGLMATLRPYQLHGLAWLQFLRHHALGGVLADDMGLGKTLQTLAHVLAEKHAGRLDRPVLIIAPVSLMGNWRKEAARFTPGLRTLVLHGAERHSAAADMAKADIVIAPYSLLQRDRERWLAQRWHLVVLDEAQNIKNANSHAAQVVSELNTRHRLCLSGTPMENHLGELWSLFHFLMPGFLGSQARFKQLFRTPIEKFGDSEQLAQLRLRITPFMLRRHKSEVATDLPEKQVSIASVELADKQADLYETIRLTTEKTVRDALENKGLAKSQIQILDALLKLRQVCCDPRLVKVPAAQKVKQSAKLELLMELLPELLAEGRKVLLFSQFTSMLTLIEEELAQRKLTWVKLTGQSQKRDELIERFTSGAVPLFLISLKAGGVGLNLTQADTVIHYDPWWNPAVETQATDRAHRIGQTQRVMVYKLVAQGTIEERILALQERKAALADSIYHAAAARKEPLFTENDLAALLQPLGR
jgi:SNF2-related domain/Helicase conserved C-terminal domain